ncbi:MAG: hypothetical protein AAFY60_08365, partial [Myxococcota bacterium]
MRWVRELDDEELALGLRSVLARASHLLTVLELLSFTELQKRVDAGAELEPVYGEIRALVQPVREASDELSQAFITIGHIEVDSVSGDGLGPPPMSGVSRARVASALNASRRLIGREWRTLKTRLSDDSVRSSPAILLTFCRAHLDRVQTLVEYIGPALFAVLAPEGVQVEAAEQEAALAIRTHVVDFHRTCTEVLHAVDASDANDWPPHLERVQESLDRLLFGIAFSWLSDTDQTQLADCRELLDQTLSLWTPLRAHPTRQVLVSMTHVGDSLLRINDRPSVVKHDLRKLESVLAIIDATLNGNESIERARA